MRAKRKLDHGLSQSKHRYGLRSTVKHYKIEDQFLRFLHISEAIFNQLDDVSLADCRKINKIWLNFIDDQRSKKIGHISNQLHVPGPLFRKQTKIIRFKENWKNVFDKTPQIIIKDLAFSVEAFMVGKKPCIF